MTALGRCALLLCGVAAVFGFIWLGLSIPASRTAPSTAVAEPFLALAVIFGVQGMLATFAWANCGYVIDAGEIQWKRPFFGPRIIAIDAIIDVRETRGGVYLLSLLGNRLWVPKDMPAFKDLIDQACLAIDRNGETLASWRIRGDS